MQLSVPRTSVDQKTRVKIPRHPLSCNDNSLEKELVKNIGLNSFSDIHFSYIRNHKHFFFGVIYTCHLVQ